MIDTHASTWRDRCFSQLMYELDHDACGLLHSAVISPQHLLGLTEVLLLALVLHGVCILLTHADEDELILTR
jgi:hypothetical protein